MIKASLILVFFTIAVALVSCGKNQPQQEPETDMEGISDIQKRINSYAPTVIDADISHLSKRQVALLEKLVEAGKIADKIFWRQTSPSSIAVRDSLGKIDSPEAKQYLEYLMINYGPYDGIYDNERFVGSGPEKRPAGGGFYPIDMTREEFQQAIANDSTMKDALESQYTVVVREGGKLEAIPYHIYYPDAIALADLLDEAAELADNPSLKHYLKLRAKAIREDDYLESDMAWMDLKDNDIDIVIGPIENYEDGLYNYKTAYEAVVMVKDLEATALLEMFENNIDEFEHRLPYDQKFIRESAGKGNILQVVNVIYFGGDCQRGVKTIAASLPNDPKVHKAKGAKKSMFKNMMEAKFQKIVVPISKVILDPSLHQFVDRKSFTSFVTLHEVSHTLGRGYVYGNDELTVRKALKEKYSAIEECKADIVGMYNIKNMLDMKLIDDDYVKRTIVTFVAGLYRSIRFGIEEAHGRSNMIQLNYLRKNGAIAKQENGTYMINEDAFFDVVGGLAEMVLTIEAEGDYKAAGKLIEDYGQMDAVTEAEIESLKDVPRDLNTTYKFADKMRK